MSLQPRLGLEERLSPPGEHGRGKDEKCLPAYVTSFDCYRAFPKSGLPDTALWQTATDHATALSPNASNKGARNAACVSNSDQTMTLSIGIEGTRDYQVSPYFVDQDNRGRRLAAEMMDAARLNLVAPVRVVKDFSGRCCLVYAHNKSARFRFYRIRGDAMPLSGVFFGPDAPQGTAFRRPHAPVKNQGVFGGHLSQHEPLRQQ